MKKQKKPVPSAEAEPVIKKQPLLKRLLFGPEIRISPSWKPAPLPFWTFSPPPPLIRKAVTTS